MNLKHIILPSAAVAGAATLLLPSLSEGFSTIGGSLGVAQRDVRLFNNFPGASANNNVTPDVNFPGYDGAEMSVWKMVVEWGSELHGPTGGGDPHQPASLGSGGANFDAFWAGNATSVGGTNDNIVSGNQGCSPNVLAFTETPISDGWRIFFCNAYSWDDGPGTIIGGMDIQGVGAHEYGHALGLGHSTVAGATMWPSVSGSGVSERSIAADDIAGVQFIYGVASASKPQITAVQVSVGSVTITGLNFAATGNEVWFTSNVATSGTSPIVKVLNATSNGTVITVAPPANAGSGDIIVKIPGSAHNTVSNAWPADLTNTSCPPPANFCLAAPNSYSAGGATISHLGTTDISNNDFVLYTQNIPPGKLTLHLYSLDQTVFVPFGDGYRCLGSPFYRIYPAQNADAFGQVFMPVDLNNLPPAGHIDAGESWGFMAWYRDPPFGGAGYNGSDAISTTWCP